MKTYIIIEEDKVTPEMIEKINISNPVHVMISGVSIIGEKEVIERIAGLKPFDFKSLKKI